LVKFPGGRTPGRRLEADMGWAVTRGGRDMIGRGDPGGRPERLGHQNPLRPRRERHSSFGGNRPAHRGSREWAGGARRAVDSSPRRPLGEGTSQAGARRLRSAKRRRWRSAHRVTSAQAAPPAMITPPGPTPSGFDDLGIDGPTKRSRPLTGPERNGTSGTSQPSARRAMRSCGDRTRPTNVWAKSSASGTCAAAGKKDAGRRFVLGLENPTEPATAGAARGHRKGTPGTGGATGGTRVQLNPRNAKLLAEPGRERW